jgi:VanZ family protein
MNTRWPLPRRSASARIWRAVLALLVALVSYLALTPTPPQQLDFGWDKLNHLLAFAALAFAAALGYPRSTRARRLAPVALLAFGGLIEILQLFVPGRSSGWGDLIADAAGIAIGTLMAAGAMRLRSRRARIERPDSTRYLPPGSPPDSQRAAPPAAPGYE